MANRLLDFQGFHMVVMEHIVEAITMGFVQQGAFAVAAGGQRCAVNGGAQISLKKAAPTGGAIRDLRSTAAARPDVSRCSLAGRIFHQHDGAGWVMNH